MRRERVNVSRKRWVIFPLLFIYASYDHFHPGDVQEHPLLIFQTIPRIYLCEHLEKEALLTVTAQLENDQEYIALTKTFKKSLTL